MVKKCAAFLAQYHILSILSLVAALSAVLYYIIFPAQGYFHADCGDTLMWAKASYESGSWISKDFSYAAILPTGGSLLMLPFIPFFGVGMVTHTIGMILFTLLLTAALWFLFHSLRFSVDISNLLTGMCLLLFSSSDKLSEMFWGHVLYYSLGILYLVVGMALALRIMDGEKYLQKKAEIKPGKAAAVLIMQHGSLILLFIAAAINWFHVIVIAILPLIGAVVLERFLDADNPILGPANAKARMIVGEMIFGTLTGLVLAKVIRGDAIAYYANFFSSYSDVSTWSQHILLFPSHWLTLLGWKMEEGNHIFNLHSLTNVFIMIGGILLLIVPIAAAFEYSKIKERGLKLMLLCHYLMSGVILFGYICGKLAEVNWRLTPMAGTAILSTLAYLTYKLRSSSSRIIPLAFAVFIVFALLNLQTIVKMPKDYGKDNDIHAIMNELVQSGLTYGYADYWYSNAIPILSDESIIMTPVTTKEENGIEPYIYNVILSRFDPTTHVGESFYLANDREYETFLGSDDWKLAKDYVVNDFVITVNTTANRYHVIVFSSNLFSLI